MSIIDSPLDGQEVIHTGTPAFFGVVVGMSEDGNYYAVEALNLRGAPLMPIAAADIDFYLAENVRERHAARLENRENRRGD